MANPELESIRRKMVYDKKETPVKNIERFFESVKTLRYEWGQITIDGKKTYYLDSAWKNEAGLQDITFKFQSSFLEHLYEISTEKVKAENFLEYLNGCRNILRIANHRYSTDLVNITVFKIRDSLAISPIPVEYDSLPVAVQIKVSNCFLLLVAFFRELKDNIEEEVSDYERKQTILKNASYVWTSDKNDLSELALAILASGAFKRKGKTLRNATFANDLAAFFGVSNLHFKQDIDLNGRRERRKRGEFIEKCKNALEEYYKSRDNYRNKTKKK